MDYLKQLLQYYTNESQSSNTSDRSPDESGQFQVIDFEEDCLEQQNKENINREKSSVSGISPTLKTPSGPNAKFGFNQSTEQQSLTADNVNQQSNRKMSKQYTFVEIDDVQPNKPENINDFKCGSASTIHIDDYYMIVSPQEVNKRFQTQEQWDNFYDKVRTFNAQLTQTLEFSLSCSLAKSESELKRNKISLNMKQLNSILEIKPDEVLRRRQLWNMVAYPPNSIRFKYTQLANKKDPKKLQINVAKIMDSLVPTILYEIADKKFKLIENIEDELQKWRTYLIKLLTFYGANDKQIGYSKGLEYIALGILVSKVFQVQVQSITQDNQKTENTVSQAISPCSSQSRQYKQLQTHFKYLMFTKQLRNMYFPGTPKLYQQIELLTELMRSQTPKLYNKLQAMEVDFIKLFINYYKTFLLYKIKSPQIIRKITELLLIYGIDLVRVLLTRIMNKNQKKILQMADQQIQFLRYLAESLVEDYFGNSDSQEVVSKFKQLFIMEFSV